FQVLLLGLSRREGVSAALDALASKEPAVRNLAATFLAMGGGRLSYLRDEEFYLSVDNPELYNQPHVGADQPFKPQPPKGPKPEILRPLLKDAHPRTAACAGYLLTLLEEPDGLGPLVSYWREYARADHEWQRLVARAVTALGEDEHVRILEEVYRSMPRDRGH